MRKILSWTFAHFMAGLYITLIVSAGLFVMFWMVIGLITFVSWSFPPVIPAIWFVIRLCLAIGIVTALLIVFSEEGKDVVNDFLKDGYKL